jgi:hypothetical protein
MRGLQTKKTKPAQKNHFSPTYPKAAQSSTKKTTTAQKKPQRHKAAQKKPLWPKPAQTGTKWPQLGPTWPNLAQNVILFSVVFSPDLNFCNFCDSQACCELS